MTASRDISRLIDIMAALRTPVTGCPWDLEQTFATIAPYTLEEAYEVADAIERGELADLKEELGDLLLQVVYHARMAEEQGAFDFGDVVHGVTAKMLRRHPHVFDPSGAELPPGHPDRDANYVNGLWARIKAEEKAEKAAERARLAGFGHEAAAPQTAGGLLADIPRALPSLTRALKLQQKAAGAGFDWPSLAPVFAKMKEEIAELEAEALPLDPRGPQHAAAAADLDRIEDELGDVLFVMANVARHLKLDPEKALARANAKFARRFAHIERRLAEHGRTPAQSSLEEMDRFWDEARAADKRKPE